MEVASIRYKNPGAMWGRTGKRPSADKIVKTNAPIPLRWGSVDTAYLSDGLGQGNNIAIFPTYVQGICAQLDLWRSSKNYRNKRFADAIHTWSGGNNVPSYIKYVKARVPGITEDTIMDDKFWRSPMGLAFLKAQAGHEAGKPYPASHEEFVKAQQVVMASPTVKPEMKTSTKVVVAAGTASTAATAAAHQAGYDWKLIVPIFVAALVMCVVTYFVLKGRKQEA